METPRSKVLDFPNPLNELPAAPDSFLDTKTSDVRLAMWRLLDGVAVAMCDLLELLDQKENPKLWDIACQIDELHVTSRRVLRESIDNYRSGRNTDHHNQRNR